MQFAIVGWGGIGTPKVSFILGGKEPRGILNSLKKNVKNIINGPEDTDIKLICEQRPFLKSKLIFDNCEDTKLNWNLHAEDYFWYDYYFRKYSAFIESNNIGEVFLNQNSIDGSFSPDLIYGCAHHMGTVRYSSLGEKFINENGKLLELKNLYIWFFYVSILWL